MGVESSAWAWKQSDLTPPQKLTLLALADHSNIEGICWPGQKYIAEKTGLSRRTIIRVIAGLVERGLIDILHRGNNLGGRSTNLYKLKVSGCVAQKPSDKVAQNPCDTQSLNTLKGQCVTELSDTGSRLSDTPDTLIVNNRQLNKNQIRSESSINVDTIIGILCSHGVPRNYIRPDDEKLIQQWINSGLTEATLHQACKKAKAAKRDQKTFGPRYLDKVLETLANETKNNVYDQFSEKNYATGSL